MKPISRTDISVFGRWWWSVDSLTLLAFLALAAAGVILVFAASPPVAERLGLPSFHFVWRHVFFLALSLALLVGASFLGRQAVWRLATLMLAGGALLTLLTLFLGTEVKGATRWLSVLGFSLQPSEFLKPAVAVVTAWLLSLADERPGFPGARASAGVLTAVCVLLLLQPDIGMAAVAACIWAAEIFVWGIPLLWVGVLSAAGVGALAGAYFLFPHFASRIDRFLDPSAGDNFQVKKSLEAFAEGGLFGKGPGHGEVKLQLPDAHADFIFAVAGEEFGMLAALFIVLVFAFVIARSLKRAAEGQDLFAILAVTGLVTQFALQAVIHMGSSLQILPAKGMTLPFISYGGSSLVALGLGMGMLLALTRRGSRAHTGNPVQKSWISHGAALG